MCVCIYLRINSDLCHLQHKLIGFYNRDEKCVLRGTDWVFKCSSLRFVFKRLNVTNLLKYFPVMPNKKIRNATFILSHSSAALSHRKPASAGISHGSCSVEGRHKRDSLYYVKWKAHQSIKNILCLLEFFWATNHSTQLP